MQKYTVTILFGTKCWFNEKGQLHREDGPAIDRENGNKHWCKNGKRHRTDGPAIEFSNGDKEWYLNNMKFNEQEFNDIMNDKLIVDNEGIKWYHNEKGELHREDGPAVEHPNGRKEWWLNDINYTEQAFNAKMSKPVIDHYGNKIWFNEKGQRHREDGPAIMCSNGDQCWYLNGIKFTEKTFNEIINQSKVVEMTMTEINKMAGCTVKIVEKH